MKPKVEVGRHYDFAIWFRRVDDAMSNSRLGGLPSLPAELKWPLNSDTKLPLHFLGQVDLSSLPATPMSDDPNAPALPRHGMLYFFAELAEGDDYRVYYSPVCGPVRAAPSDIKLIFPLGIDGHPSTTFPSAHLQAYALQIDARVADMANHQADPLWLDAAEKATGLSAPILDEKAYETAMRAWPIKVPSFYVHRFSNGDSPAVDKLQMFGVPHCFQHEGRKAIAEGRHLLMQFEDRNFGETMRDVLIQFWIMPDDLKHVRFDKAWATLEN
jgi:hypothetical protein